MSLWEASHDGPRLSYWSGRWLRPDAPSTTRLKSWLKTNSCARNAFAAASRKRLPEPCCLRQSSSKRIPYWVLCEITARPERTQTEAAELHISSCTRCLECRSLVYRLNRTNALRPSRRCPPAGHGIGSARPAHRSIADLRASARHLRSRGKAQGGNPCYRSNLRPPRPSDASRCHGRGLVVEG